MPFLHATVALAVLVGLVATSRHSYLLFHSLAELFAVVIGLLLGVVAWNTVRLSRNHFLTFLGLAYPWVALVDLVHTLAYKGMGVFPEAGANLPTQLWLVARFIEALTLLAAPAYLTSRLPRLRYVVGLYAAVTTATVALVFGGAFPTAFVEGVGLTPFKVGSEYAIVALLLAAGWRLWRRRQTLDRSILGLVAGAWALTVIGELAFTLYVDVYGLSNLVGHLAKLGSFWLVFVGLVRTSLTEPFRLLARDSSTYDAIPEEILVVDRQGRVRQINRVLRERLGERAAHALGTHCHDLVHPRDLPRERCPVCQAIAAGRALDGAELPFGGRWLDVSLAPVREPEATMAYVHVARDITARKRAEEGLKRANRAYRAISASNQALVRMRDESELLDKVTRIIVERGGYRMAWVGFPGEEATRRLQPVAFAGAEEGFLSEVAFSWGDDAQGASPAGTAFRTGRPVVVNALAEHCPHRPWQAAAARRGYAAAAAFPLARQGDATSGVMVIYAAQQDAFSDEEVAVLGELAADLGFGIAARRTQLAREAAEADLRLRTAALESAGNGIAILSARDRRCVYANDALSRITGQGRQCLLGETCGDDPTIRALFSAMESGREVTDRQGVRPDGTAYWYDLKVSAVASAEGPPSHWVGVVNDVTERVAYERELEYQAHHDALTALPNRTLLRDRMEQAIGYAARMQRAFAVVFLDLDRFKLINDGLGHDAGDRVLQAVAKRLLACVRDIDSVTRYGGDEFVLLLPEVESSAGLEEVTTRVLASLAEPVLIDGHEIHLTLSAGVAFFPTDGERADVLLRHADAAMYRAKELGRDNIQFFRTDLGEKAYERINIEGQLHRALELGQLVVHYQPQIDNARREVFGAEALIRWLHPEHGLIPPGRFIPVAEESGLIGRIGDWVLRAACLQAAAWWRADRKLRMAVNVSVRQLRDPEFVGRVAQVLTETGLDPAALELEVTESSVMSEPAVMTARLQELRALGIGLSIDDFGTGYSSLSYLKQLPVTRLKIDQAFIRNLVNDPEDAAIVRTVIDVARSLRFEVLAEGVETEAQLHYLTRQGCHLMQGFLFSRAVTAQEFELFLAGPLPLPPPLDADAPPALLVLDDDVNITHALKRLLRKEPYDLLLAQSPDEAFELMARHRVGVVVSDQRMPAMRGTEFLRRVRELHPDVIRMVLSGYTDLETVTEAVNRGWIFKFLTKPWDDATLVKEIRAAFQEHQRGRAAASAAGQ